MLLPTLPSYITHAFLVSSVFLLGPLSNSPLSLPCFSCLSLLAFPFSVWWFFPLSEEGKEQGIGHIHFPLAYITELMRVCLRQTAGLKAEMERNNCVSVHNILLNERVSACLASSFKGVLKTVCTVPIQAGETGFQAFDWPWLGVTSGN